MSTPIRPKQGISTLVNHAAEGIDPNHAHVTPIYQTSSFSFPDVDTGAGIFRKETPGYYYTRVAGPNLRQLAEKVSVLEGLDLLRAEPQRPLEEVAAGVVFVVLGVWLVWTSRKRGGPLWWTILRRALIAVVALFIVYWVVLPVSLAIVATERPNPATRIGRSFPPTVSVPPPVTASRSHPVPAVVLVAISNRETALAARVTAPRLVITPIPATPGLLVP